MKLAYQFETEIDKPLKDVIRLYADRSLYPKWQPGLVDIEPTAVQPVPTYKLTMQFGRRKMVMTEMVLDHNLPTHYEVVYTMRGIRNRNESSFESVSGSRTRWVCREEFTFKGLMNLVVPFMKDGFKKQSSIIINNFKKFAESQ